MVFAKQRNNTSRNVLWGVQGRRNPHRSCYTKKRKSEKLRNRDRWDRNNQPWLGGDYVR